MLRCTQKLVVSGLHLRVQRKMQHQPTESSVAAAEVEAGRLSPEESTAVKTAMTRAREANGAGDKSACEQALADVKRLLGSPGTQSEHQ